VEPCVRIAPRPAPALLLFIGYLVVFYGVWIMTGVEYDNIGDSVDTLMKWYVAPLAAGAVVLVAGVSWFGWWRPVLVEKVRAPRWLVVAPLLMAVLAFVQIAISDKSGTSAAMYLPLIVGSLLVGFCEETATRGVLLTGFRGTLTEPKVWFLSTLCFGLLHLPNWVFGAGPAATAQVFLAFAGGTALYLTRRVTGSLIWAMLLHGLWDFSSFVGDLPPAASFSLFLIGLVALLSVWRLLASEKGQQMAQAGVSETPAPA
jgi:membrane protease YdiL (CAAX protease family)